MKQVLQAGELRSARVESLRALAALSVFAFHSYSISHASNQLVFLNGVGPIFRSGQYGVGLFFCLTGYLLYWPFVKRMRSGGSIELRRYLRNRALRILPLYYLSVPIAAVLVHDTRNLVDHWAYFVLLVPTFSTKALGVNVVLWSLAVEIQFYILLPLIATALARISHNRRAVIAGMLICSGVGSYFFRKHWMIPHSAHILALHVSPSAWYRSVAAWWFHFVPGMLLALLRDYLECRLPERPGRLYSHSSVWLFTGAVITVLAVMWVPHAEGAVAEELVLLPAFFFIVGGAILPLRVGRLVRPLEWRPLAALGVASYSFYVWHRVILVAVADGRLWPTIDFYALTMAMAILVAFLSYKLIEKPFLSLRGRWSDAAPAHVAMARRRTRRLPHVGTLFGVRQTRLVLLDRDIERRRALD
jgi:peptidoglycan/LPS O-acetylase OafA/YrhL